MSAGAPSSESAVPAPSAAPPPGRTVNRIHWVPGTDRLLAVCYCAAEREFEDPVELWDWLLGHPGAEPAVHAFPPGDAARKAAEPVNSRAEETC